MTVFEQRRWPTSLLSGTLSSRRLEVKGWGDGIIITHADSLATLEHKGSVFGFFHPEIRFQKSAFTGSMWTIVQMVQNLCFYTQEAFPCGWPLTHLQCSTEFPPQTAHTWAHLALATHMKASWINDSQVAPTILKLKISHVPINDSVMTLPHRF